MAPVPRRQSRQGAGPSVSVSGDSDNRADCLRFRPSSKDLQQSLISSLPDQADVPPIYCIDLSLPPRERYKVIARDYKHRLESLTGLFDDVLDSLTHSNKIYMKSIKVMSRLFLRRVYSKEETEELRGIHDVTGINMYLLVVFNVLLDCLMGCTSGGVRVQDGSSGSNMMHFRTLDWGMDPLREVIIQLEFKHATERHTLARSITYAGFVGILTGVRRNLSVSLNFRPTHNNSGSFASNARYVSHCLLVLLGLRPSISHLLRNYVLPDSLPGVQNRKTPRGQCQALKSLGTIAKELPEIPTTACYLTFSNGEQTSVFEKDHVTANIRSSEAFITATNHDKNVQGERGKMAEGNNFPPSNRAAAALPLENWIQESTERLDCVEKLWETAEKSHYRKHSKRRASVPVAVSERTAARWMTKWPISNECTHYWCLMDPKTGEVRVCVRYLWPLEEPMQL